MINRITKVYFKRPHKLVSIIGREHWSSGYGDDSCSSGRGFESRSCIYWKVLSKKPYLVSLFPDETSCCNIRPTSATLPVADIVIPLPLRRDPPPPPPPASLTTTSWPLSSVWPDSAIYWTLGNFSKPVATISLPKSPTFLGNFCKGVKISHFSSEIIFGQLL